MPFIMNPGPNMTPGGAMARGYGEPGGRAAMAVNTNRMLGMMNNLGYGVDRDAIMSSMFPNFRQPPNQTFGAAMPMQGGAPVGGPDIGAPVGPVATMPDTGLNTAPQRRRIGGPANPVEAMGGAPPQNKFGVTPTQNQFWAGGDLSGGSLSSKQPQITKQKKRRRNQQGTSAPVNTVAY